MPLYDYQCKQCQKVTEVRHGFKDVYAEACPNCGGVLSRVFNPAGIVFKGSGFYITDSRKGGDKTGDKTGSEKSGGEKSGGESVPAAAAPAPAAPAASATSKSDAA